MAAFFMPTPSSFLLGGGGGGPWGSLLWNSRSNTGNMSSIFERQTANSQSSRADETYHYCGCHFYPILQTHSLSVNSFLADSSKSFPFIKLPLTQGGLADRGGGMREKTVQNTWAPLHFCRTLTLAGEAFSLLVMHSWLEKYGVTQQRFNHRSFPRNRPRSVLSFQAKVLSKAKDSCSCC